MTKDKYNLISRSKEELIALVNELMNKLTEEDRIEFVSKWIDPEKALIEAGANDSCSFIKRAEEFCSECMEGKYYREPDYGSYNSYYSYEDDEDYGDYSGSEWAKEFLKLIKISIMFARNKNYNVSYKAFGTLLNCIHEAEFDEEIFGIDNPMDYIDIDWDEMFEEYYISLRNQILDEEQAADKAVEIWISFGEICTESILNNFKDNPHMEKVIRKNIEENCENWQIQHSLYGLLKSFYLKLNLEFDEIMAAKSLACYNPNFLNEAVQGYINIKMWDEAVKTIEEAMSEVQDQRMVSALNRKLADCYENLNKFNEAYDITVKMFKNDSSHELYLRARNLAVKTGELNNFTDNMLVFVKSSKKYDSASIILRILSFEGNTSELINTALKSEGYSRHDYLKFTVKSLIYRAAGDKNIKLNDLQEFIQRIKDDKIDGIVDMTRNPKDCEIEYQLLNSSVDILKLMVKFHIDAAQRARYARAAYYCAIIKDIYIYMNEKEKFDRYYSKILLENKRRPALKDEMKKKVY